MVSRLFAAVLVLLTLGSSSRATIVVFDTTSGYFFVRLYNSATPASVANFLGYVNRGDYQNVMIHRSVSNFVIQGGRYRFDGSSQVQPMNFPEVAQGPAVINEPGISNLRGTLAFAKAPNLPNSASREWFFNLANNSANLDFQNGGFTVFGRVLGSGMNIVDAMAAVPKFGFMSPWDTAPMRNYSAADYFNHFPVGINHVIRMNIYLINARDGDYNGDGAVNQTDIQYWNSTLGSRTLAEADGNGDGIVNQADYDMWRANLDNAPVAPKIKFDSVVRLPNGAFELTFTNSPGLSLSIIGSSSPTSPPNDWTPLGLVPEISPGHYKFTDTSGFSRRFFRVSEP